LDAEYNQGLTAISQGINSSLRMYFETEVLGVLTEEDHLIDRLKGSIKLVTLRNRIRDRYINPEEPPSGAGGEDTPAMEAPIPFDLIANFEVVTQAMISESEKLGAELLFVYIPEYESIIQGEEPQRETYREGVMEVIDRAGLPYLDLGPVLSLHENPRSLWALGIRGHFSPAGYQVVADSTLELIASQQ